MKKILILFAVISILIIAGCKGAEKASENIRETTTTPLIQYQSEGAKSTNISIRPATTVCVRIDDKNCREYTFKEQPYIQDSMVNILAGEVLYIQFDLVNGMLVNPRRVMQPNDKTITFDFTQSRDKPGTILKVTNAFTEKLTYKLAILVEGQGKMVETSASDVEAQVTGSQTWQKQIVQFLARGFSLVK